MSDKPFDAAYHGAGSSLYYSRPSPWLSDLTSTQTVSGWRIGDLGCGDGRNSLALIARGAHVIACDISRLAVEKLAALAPNISKSGGVLTPIIGDLRHLDWPAECFDLMILATVVDNFSRGEARQIVERAKRAVRPNGLIFISAFTDQDPASGISQLPASVTLDANCTFLGVGEIVEWLSDFHIVRHEAVLEEDNSHGPVHFHGIERVLARK